MFLLVNKENSICGVMGLLKHDSSENSLEIDNVIKFKIVTKKIFFESFTSVIKFFKRSVVY